MSNLYKFYLKMHIGAPSVSCVKEGEFVERGQVIAEPNGLGARIHSSVSGKVFKITNKEILVEASENQSEDFAKIKNAIVF